MSEQEMDIDDDDQLYKRNLADVKSIIKHAKLTERSLTEVTQALYYPSASSESSERGMKLLELDEHLMQQIQVGQTLMFKGGMDEKAVLCTDERTYDIKWAEISNSLLLVPEMKFGAATSTSPLKSPRNGGGGNNSLEEGSLNDSGEEVPVARTLEQRQVAHIFHEYLECREIRPRYRKLSELLRLTRYSGPENEEFIDRSVLFTYNQLLDTIQCSRQQFEEGLRLCRAVAFEGRMRTLECDYEYRIINLMVGLIGENSWALDAVERAETLEALHGIAPEEIVAGLFQLYTTPSSDSDRYAYREELVARIVAQNILQPGLKFRIEEFMSTWQEALPEGMQCQDKYLRGLGIFDKDGCTPCIRSLAEEDLPTNIHERIKILFKTKSKWTLLELEPYVTCFTTPTLSVSMLLAKHARSLTEQGVRYYVAKH